MAKHIVNAPDGTRHIINAPDDATPDQVIEYARNNIPQDAPDQVNSPEGTDMGKLAAFVGGANQAVPFGRKITSALGAAGALGLGKMQGLETGSFGELYNQAEQNAAATSEANPWMSGLGTVAGIGATLPLASAKVLSGVKPTEGIRGAINAIPQGLAKIGDFARGGNLAVRAGKGAALAAPMGALYGAGEAKTGEELAGAGRGAGLAAGIGAALPVAGAAIGAGVAGAKNIASGYGARNADELAEAATGIKSASSKLYQRMRDIGAVFTPQSKADIFGKISKEVSSDGPLNQGLHGSTMSLLDDLNEAAQKSDFGLEELDQYRRLFSRIPRTNPEDVRKASIVIDALDDAVNDLSENAFSKGGKDAVNALNSARKEYNRFSKFDRLAKIIQETGGDANKIKSSLQRFVNNPKKTRGFSQEEIKAIQEAARNSTGEGLLKMAGKFGIDLGSSLSVGNAGLPALLGAATAVGSSAGVGAGAVAAGTVARQAHKWLARGKVENILKLIESGAEVGVKEISELPPSDAKKLLNMLKLQGSAVSGIGAAKTITE